MLSVKKCYFVLDFVFWVAIILVDGRVGTRLLRMEVNFAQAELERLERDIDFNAGLGRDVVKAYRKCMQLVRAAYDERDLYAFKSRRFEKLQGDRAHQHSLRLNDRWRLSVEIVKKEPKNVIRVIAIEDYH